MKTKYLKSALLLSVFALVLSLPSTAWTATEISYGVQGSAWDSNLNRTGTEALFPVSFLWRAPSNVIQFRLSSAYMMGRYRIQTGVFDQSFTGQRMTDTRLGMDLSKPLGKMALNLSLMANLPSGDEKWETYQIPGNLPILFTPSRYRGRGFGFNSLLALGMPLGGKWSLTASGGYLLNGSVDLGLVGVDEVDLGDSVMAGLALSRRSGPSLLRIRAISTFPSTGKVSGESSFQAPPATAMSVRLETGHVTRMVFQANLDVFGKAKVLDSLGALVSEETKSFGTRLTLTPSVEYRLGSRTRMSTAARFKKVFSNDVVEGEARYEAGGILLGGEQSLKWKMTGGFTSRLYGGYDRILHKNSALDESADLTDVTYNVVSFGTGMVYQW